MGFVIHINISARQCKLTFGNNSIEITCDVLKKYKEHSCNSEILPIE